MITISLCMIVKNDEELLERCLKSCANAFDEIVIVDMGSEDRTIEIAQKFTDNTYKYHWNGDFSAARNFSFSKASGDYIMWLDAADIILPSDLNELKILKKVMSRDIDIVMMKYNVGFDQSGHITASFFRERLLRRAMEYRWQDPVHEYIPITGKVINADVSVTRGSRQEKKPGTNFEIYKNMIRLGVEFSSRNILYYARELRDHELYDQAIEQYTRFLSTAEGWAEDYISACFELSFIYKHQEDHESMVEVLLSSFRYASPRAETCCQIGEYHFERGAYKQAIFWYELALKLEKPISWRFMFEDYWGYIPYLQLCLCNYHLGETKKAAEYNLLAKNIKPNDASVITNERFFEDLRLQEQPGNHGQKKKRKITLF